MGNPLTLLGLLVKVVIAETVAIISSSLTLLFHLTGSSSILVSPPATEHKFDKFCNIYQTQFQSSVETGFIDLFTAFTVTFDGQMKLCHIECTSSLSRKENTVPQWAYKCDSALDVAEAWHLKSHMLKIK